MSFRVGLGASEDDIEVQGEIDFDFFEDCVSSSKSNADEKEPKVNTDTEVQNTSPSSSNDLKSPVITVSYDNSTGAVNKTSIEAVIPSPEDYTGNNCGTTSSNVSIQGSKSSTDNNEDDSSVSSSFSSSDSELSSSLHEESFGNTDGTDSMTDVSPLPTHSHSPLVKPEEVISPDNSFAAESITSSQCQKESVKFSDAAYQNSGRQESAYVNHILKAIKKLEIDKKRPKSSSSSSTPFVSHMMRNRKNVTFSNDEVRKIDRDNQYLLKKIVSQQNRPKPHFSSLSCRPSSSAINRQKQQRQIELDNLAFLKRLEATKPSRELSRAQLLNDYKRNSCLSSRASTRPASRSSSHFSSMRSSAHSGGRTSILLSHGASKTSKE